MLGSQTDVVNGTRFTLPTSDMFHPNSYGQQTTGVPQVSPTMPPMIGGAVSSAGTSGAVSPVSGGPAGDPSAGENIDGYGTAGNNATTTQIAADNPRHVKVSPLWWTVGALVVGLALLRVVHWRVEGGASAGS